MPAPDPLRPGPGASQHLVRAGSVRGLRRLASGGDRQPRRGTSTYLYIFIIGHLVGPLLLGMALARARAIPRWSPIMIAVSIPLHILAFVTGTWYVDPIAYALLAVALIPAARAALKSGPLPAAPPA